MSGFLTPEKLMSKAGNAYESAKKLIERGDTNGAADRAYYAMFNAARAALLASGAMTIRQDIGKTHNRLITAFGEHLVKPGKISREMGRSINRALEIRQVADDQGDSVDLQEPWRGRECLFQRLSHSSAVYRQPKSPGSTNRTGAFGLGDAC